MASKFQYALRKRMFRGVTLAALIVLALSAATIFRIDRLPAMRLAMATEAGHHACNRLAPGSEIGEPEDLRSQDGVLDVTLVLKNERADDGSVRYCYALPDGSEEPTLHVRPGDLLVIHLQNALTDLGEDGPASPVICRARPIPADRACAGSVIGTLSTNLHFHGMAVGPRCGADDVLHTVVNPGDAPFVYRFRIPSEEPPGLYWYHPHVHGITTPQVQGGASGALIVEGIENAVPDLAGLPERVLVIRDQPLLHRNAATHSPSGLPASQPVIVDADGDAVNTGTGGGRPARDLSVNGVPVPYPDYPAATVRMKPGERQLWRVLNASTVTYLQLATFYRRGPRYRPQWIEVVGIDGVPLAVSGAKGHRTEWRDSVLISPGARVEFVLTAPPPGVPGILMTRSVNTGRDGENDPARPLLNIVASGDAPSPISHLPAATRTWVAPQAVWLGDAKPVRERHLYFSEDPLDPANPAGQHFYLTVDGQKPVPFDPNNDVPNIVTRQGDVEDWIIENRTRELHAFHIHQLHFQLVEWMGFPVHEPFLRDTINVPFANGANDRYPSVRLRMDFRGSDVAGTFVYHCHLLDHEDAGMMGLIRVDPQLPQAAHANAPYPATMPMASRR